MIENAYQKDVTADIALGDVDFEANRKAGKAGYNFLPHSFIICPSADDADEWKTIVYEPFSGVGVITAILRCGVVHQIPVKKIFNSGTVGNTIIVLGMSD